MSKKKVHFPENVSNVIVCYRDTSHGHSHRSHSSHISHISHISHSSHSYSRSHSHSPIQRVEAKCQGPRALALCLYSLDWAVAVAVAVATVGARFLSQFSYFLWDRTWGQDS